MSTPGTGKRIGGFVVIRRLAQGGMGVVYLARDERLDRLVAVKVVSPELVDDERFRRRLLAESQMAARLEHPAIVPVYAAGEDEGQLFLAMRFVPGGTLGERLAGSPLDPAATIEVLGPVAEALDAAHTAGLVHRDVKPANILLDGERGMLADFGLARRAASVASLSRGDGFAGTMGYIAPEQIEGDHVDGRADQYALACVAFECLTGRAPFARDSDVATIHAHLADPPPRASESWPGLPAAVDAVFARGLAKRPGDRYSSCEAFVAALDAALAVPEAANRMRPRRVLLAAVALAVVAAVGAGIVLSRRGTPPLPVSAPNDLVRLDAVSGRVLDALPIGDRPTAVAVATDGVWVALGSANQVVRVDPTTGQVTLRVATPDSVTGLVAAGGAVWATVDLKRLLLRIDPASGQISQQVGVANGPGAITATPGALWIASQLDGTVSRFDPARGVVTKTIPIGSGVTALVSAFGSVWATSESYALVTRIDPVSGEVIGTIPVGHSPVALAAAAGSLWVANRDDGTVSRLDPARNAVVETVPVGRAPGTLTGAGGVVWVGDDATGDVYRLDPGTMTARPTTNLRATATSIVASGRELLAATVDLPSSQRGGTLVMADANDYWEMDPALAYGNPTTWVWDTLVRYRRTAGSAGFQIVPDLAEAIPQPTDNGTTYTFHIRRHIRYSTGAEVVPSDFVHAFDRVFRGTFIYITGPPGPASQGGLFSGLVGADACINTSKACHLSAGIAADDAAGTVTFHLKQRDPNFLRNLTETQTAPVPPGTRLNGSAYVAVAGTGPYIMASQTRDKQLIFRRNPYFRVWSADARPDGNVDEIRWLLGLNIQQQVAMVESGRADSNYSELTPAITERLIRLYPAQIHLNTPAVQGYWLDTRRWPLSSLDVRRAINYAVDRTAIVGSGPWYMVPTCQTLLPGTAGYLPYCPYAGGGLASGAPDLAHARALVQRAGATGARVTIWTYSGVPGDPNNLWSRWGPMQRAVIDALRAIGLRVVEYRTATNQGPQQGDNPAATIQWDFYFGNSTPADTLTTITGACSSDDIRHGWFCDAGTKRLLQQAENAPDPTTQARAWTALDHHLTDAAAWLPIGNGINSVFLSKRVGNYAVQADLGGSLYDLVTVR